MYGGKDAWKQLLLGLLHFVRNDDFRHCEGLLALWQSIRFYTSILPNFYSSNFHKVKISSQTTQVLFGQV